MQKDYNHFNVFFNRKTRKKGFYHNISYKKDMTYILGARCKDGVVLVADTKVTIGDGTDYTYEKKITRLLDNVIMGSSGLGGSGRDFQNRIITAVVGREKRRFEEGNNRRFPPITTEHEYSVLVSNVINDMHRDYGDRSYLIAYNLMILCGTRIGSTSAQLTTFTGDGYPEPVNQVRAIGHREPYGSIFLKKM
jgi:20S proteasome alpha/beta subunit